MAQVIPDSGLDTERTWQPATFAERGVSVPFTTPALAGARARLGARGLEAIVPQPAGAKGVYILAWAALADQASLSVHDLRLAELIAAGVRPNPPGIRAVAAQVAQQGLAGRAARNAVGAGAERLAHAQLTMNAALLERLVEQMKGAPGNSADLERRAKPCLNALAERVGRPAHSLLDDIRVITELCISHRLLPETMGGDKSINSVDGMVAALRALGPELRAADTKDVAACAVLLAARRCESMVAQATSSARAALADVAGLLATWSASRPGFTLTIGRPDWLLDGWQQIVSIWRLADPMQPRHAIITEMAMMIPHVPREASGWPGDTGEDAAWAKERRQVAARAATASLGGALDLVARNEQIRALAA